LLLTPRQIVKRVIHLCWRRFFPARNQGCWGVRLRMPSKLEGIL
jgi:hypothetical protein